MQEGCDRVSSRPLKGLVGALVGLVLCVPPTGLVAAGPVGSLEARANSPENQIFQFMHSAACTNWADGSSSRAVAYLWIPEECERLRGLVILGANVPEHRLAGHPAIREACAANNLGIVWCVPSFMNFRKDQARGINNALDYRTTTAFLQQLLDGLAATSGYDEVARVPWLPMGESGHLLMVDALVEERPERCIAGVWLKNNHLPPRNRTVPALVAYGTAQEWSQTDSDIRTNWNNVGKAYAGIMEQRRKYPGWPLSFVMDGGSGHFDCSEAMTHHVARYIDLAARARLSDDGSSPLKPVQLEQGFLAGLAAPGHEERPVSAFSESPPAARNQPWFFDRRSAVEAQSFAAINWEAETQIPAFADGDGKVLPFDFGGITSYTPTMEADGITFVLRGVMLDQLPPPFVNAGTRLAKTPGSPALEWLCGPVKPIGGDRFQIALDRSWPSSACYLAARQPGSATIRASVQPCGIRLKRNDAGLKQSITFEPVPDVTRGTRSVRLVARSNADLPVRFFVRAGPAVVHGDELVFSPVPPRSRFPLTVTVTAWQWGRSVSPPVQTASPVEQQFKILAIQ